MKFLFSYVTKLNIFRPWNFFILSTSPLLLAYIYYSTRKGYSFLNIEDKENQRKKKMKCRIDRLFEQLKGHDILFANEGNCRNKIQFMMEGGQEFLQIISDFDRTMSRYMINGQCNLTCHEIIECYPGSSINLKTEHDSLRQQYYPIEVNTALTNDEKIPYMVEWWTKAHDIMVNSNIKQSIFDKTVKECNLSLRIDCDKFMSTLDSHSIPLLIFSAGLGNVIEILLSHKGLLYDNVRIVSNFMNFNNEGVLIGFQDSVIHSFNKYAKSIQDSEFYESICTKRRNVILLGDSTGDPHMSDGLADNANVLKIGFLNSNVDNLRERYKSIYDLVIVSDESFTVPRLILDAVLDTDSWS